MLPTNETFLTHKQHPSDNMLLETFQHTLGHHIAGKHVSPVYGGMFPATCC